ncbi:hypothetical protein CRG98_015217 [Punica granatum]|uniref:Uncharacterized protein n=1 Tax=Punica granatum TaxID=22663 RepID=A0A2I0K745_PUNGR|nr:hypothetical protein CRG98_015217 [Punica granatum]
MKNYNNKKKSMREGRKAAGFPTEHRPLTPYPPNKLAEVAGELLDLRRPRLRWGGRRRGALPFDDDPTSVRVAESLRGLQGPSPRG